MIKILCAWHFTASVICSLRKHTYVPLYAVEVFLSFPSHYQAAVVGYLGSVRWSRWPSLGCLH